MFPEMLYILKRLFKRPEKPPILNNINVGFRVAAVPNKCRIFFRLPYFRYKYLGWYGYPHTLDEGDLLYRDEIWGSVITVDFPEFGITDYKLTVPDKSTCDLMDLVTC